MGRYYKNRRRCNTSKEKLKIYIFIIIVLISVSVYFTYLNKKVKETLINYVDVEVERVFTNIINRVLRENNVKFNDYLIYNKEDKNNISYDIDKVNEYTDYVSEKINEELYNLENEYIDNKYDYKYYDKNKYKYIRKGLLYEFSFNSINNNILFGNLGASIPIKISFLGSVNSSIEIVSKDYGINNIIIEAYLNISVKSYTTMPVGSNIKDVSTKELVFVDIINGNVPNYIISSVK